MTATATTPREIPAQADVRTRGAVTTVKLTAAGKATIQRVDALLDELGSNSAVSAELRDACKEAQTKFSAVARSVGQ